MESDSLIIMPTYNEKENIASILHVVLEMKEHQFDALVIDDEVLHPDEYSLLHRLERFIYVGDDRQILHRFCRGQIIEELKEI